MKLTKARKHILQHCLENDGSAYGAGGVPRWANDGPGRRRLSHMGGSRRRMLEAMRLDGLLDHNNKITAKGRAAIANG